MSEAEADPPVERDVGLDAEPEPETAGVSSSIAVFLRMRPQVGPSSGLELVDSTATFTLPRASDAGCRQPYQTQLEILFKPTEQDAALKLPPAARSFVNNLRERFQFSFDGVFAPDCSQEEVFATAAQPIVAAALEGFNGTLFAYGQTGSGKTFTMTGGAGGYEQRGIIPRAVALVFSEIAARPAQSFVVRVAYLEIYNEVGYDLLDRSGGVRGLDDLPRVQALEDEAGELHLRNLGLHRAESEEQALNLLFLGDTNRAIGSTPANPASSRSHCIFTLLIEARQVGGERVRTSKLNLVDLAGSERVTRTRPDGTTLREARHINLSLHYLEHVILALQERSRGAGRAHVPYRNSMLTAVLRDSLGGNANTAMVATVSGQEAALPESLATCRFAQRVARVRNQVTVNEELDPWMVIARLQQEVRSLKAELSKLRPQDPDAGSQEADAPLGPGELSFIRSRVEAFVAAPPDAAEPLLPGSDASHTAAFSLLRDMLLEARELPPSRASAAAPLTQAVRIPLPPAEQPPAEAPAEPQPSRRPADASLAVAQLASRQRLLKHKCQRAQAAGQAAQVTKRRLEQLRQEVEAANVRRIMLGSCEAVDATSDPMLQPLLAEMAQVRAAHQAALTELGSLRAEIVPLFKQLQASGGGASGVKASSSQPEAVSQPSDSQPGAEAVQQLMESAGSHTATPNGCQAGKPEAGSAAEATQEAGSAAEATQEAGSSRREQPGSCTAEPNGGRPALPAAAEEAVSVAGDSWQAPELGATAAACAAGGGPEACVPADLVTGLEEVDCQVQRFYGARARLLARLLSGTPNSGE